MVPQAQARRPETMPLMEKLRKAEDIYGHKCKARDYRVLLHDRSKKAMQRTMKALHLSPEAIARVVRLTAEHQRMRPDEILAAAIERTPGVEAWVIEGLDLWIPDINKMEIVGPIIDSIRASRRALERRRDRDGRKSEAEGQGSILWPGLALRVCCPSQEGRDGRPDGPPQSRRQQQRQALRCPGSER